MQRADFAHPGVPHALVRGPGVQPVTPLPTTPTRPSLAAPGSRGRKEFALQLSASQSFFGSVYRLRLPRRLDRRVCGCGRAGAGGGGGEKGDLPRVNLKG